MLDTEIGDTEQHIDALIREYVVHHVGDLGIVALEHALAPLHECDPAAQMAKQLAQLEANIAGADDDQVLRQLLQVQK